MADLDRHVLVDNTVTSSQRMAATTSVVNQDKTPAQKATLATSLSDAPNGITCNVIAWVGNYCNVKWFKNNKPYGGWETYNYVDTVKPLAALTTLKTQG